MILVANPTKPFEFTPKGTPRRAQIIATYESEIDQIYAALDEMSQTEPPTDWSPENTLRFVGAVMNSVLKRTISDTEDIFEGGCDRWVSSRCSLLASTRLVFVACKPHG